MSLRDGTKKMSKSDPSEQSRISLTDDADTIALKIRRAKSDSVLGITYDPESAPEASNLLTIYAALARPPARRGRGRAARRPPSPTSRPAWPSSRSRSWPPSTPRCAACMADPGHLDRLLRDGAERADAIAEPVLARGLRRGGLPAAVRGGRLGGENRPHVKRRALGPLGTCKIPPARPSNRCRNGAEPRLLSRRAKPWASGRSCRADRERVLARRRPGPPDWRHGKCPLGRCESERS